MKITKLSQTQIDRFQEWREKWIAIGLDTGRADFCPGASALSPSRFQNVRPAHIKSQNLYQVSSSVKPKPLRWVFIHRGPGVAVDPHRRDQVHGPIHER